MQVEGWIERTIAEVVRLLPRIGVAVLVVAVILMAAEWARRSTWRARDRGPKGPAGFGAAGGLAAATAASAILGARTIAAALLIFLLFYVGALIAQLIAERVLRRSRVGAGAIELLLAVLHAALIAVGAVEALATLGLNVAGIVAGLGIAGLAVGFAAQDTLANLIAGFTLLWDHPLRVGDWVQVGDSPPGRVRHLTLRTTRLETIDLGMLIIPNKDVTGARLYNFSILDTERIRLAVGVPIDADLEAARRTLLDVAARDSDVAQEPAPAVSLISITDAALTLELVVATNAAARIRGIHARLLEGILVALRAAGLKPMGATIPADAGRGPWP
jgi:small conductance mechanosensitive channel